MTTSSNTSLIKRPSYAVQQLDDTPDEIILAPPPTPKPLYPQNQVNLSRPDDSNPAERDIWQFFEQECNGGWHPTSKYGRAVVKSLANCLVDLAQARYADLRVVYFDTNIPYQNG